MTGLIPKIPGVYRKGEGSLVVVFEPELLLIMTIIESVDSIL